MDADRVPPPAGDLGRVARLDLPLEQALPFTLGDLGEARLGTQARDRAAGGGEGGGHRLRRLPGAGERGVDDGDRLAGGDRQARREIGGRQAGACEGGLAAAERGERRVGAPLEPPLREPDGLAVAQEHDGGREVARHGKGRRDGQ